MKAEAIGGATRDVVPRPSMSLAEARKVPWLRSRPKPLGELMEEGFLSASRLEWAAKKAYDPALKEAAQVLLKWQSGTGSRTLQQPQSTAPPSDAPPKHFPLAMSVEEARSTKWPFGALHDQPMGELSETRQLSLKDLAYAVENARDERVRHAAIALLLVRLDQTLEEPPQKAGILSVVAAGRSYAEGRQLSLAFLEGSISGAGLAVALVYLVGSLVRERPPTASRLTLAEMLASPESTVAFLVVLLLLAAIFLLGHFGIQRLFKGLDQQIEAYRKGEEGEGRVIEKAMRALNGDWTAFRNVVLPGRRRADLDIVLVGPPGVWAIEVKTLSGEYRNVGEAWHYQAGSRWRRMTSSPSRQARDGAIALKELLRADGIKTYIPAVVAWADQAGRVSSEDPTVPVWTLDRIEDELGNLWNGHGLASQTQQRIVEKLTRLCQAPRKGAW